MHENAIYYNYLKPDTEYFEFNATDSVKSEFNINNLPINCTVTTQKGSPWKFYSFEQYSLKEQGWKIHISAPFDKAEQILQDVGQVLIQKGYDFKHIANQEILHELYSKNGDRVSSGKFIVIYPPDDYAFLNLLNLLYDEIYTYEQGPYVLNDKCWKDSNIYYRYGGFKNMFNKNGEACIKNEKGELIPDERNAYYTVPSFVKEFDEYLDDLNYGNFSDVTENNKLNNYEFQSALRFSNSGGIYLAKDKSTNKKVIIKEARPKVGLDGSFQDAIQRQKIEYEKLSALSDVDGIINIVDYFKYWKHTFLVEDYIEGVNLQSWMAMNYPFYNDSDIHTYKENVKKIIFQLISIIEDMHNENIGMGDLQPLNIMVSEDLNLTLIDFETALPKDSEESVTLQTPGFSSKFNKNNEERDWYSLKKILRYCVLPMGPVTNLDKNMFLHQDRWIKRKFGGDFLFFVKDIMHKCNQHLSVIEENTNNLSDIENYEAIKDPSLIISKMRANIKRNLISDRRLIHGDVRQFEQKDGFINVLSGGTGAVLSLNRSGGINKAIINWIETHLMQDIDSISEKGLFTGATGIASTLYEVGYKEKSFEIFNRSLNDMNMYDISLRSGLAGIGLAFISLYIESKDESYLIAAKSIAKKIDNFIESNQKITVRDWSGVSIGLIDGWSGGSLFYSALFAITKKENYYLKAFELISKDLKHTIQDEKSKALHTLDDRRRALPYLSGGSIGIGLAIIYLNHVSGEKLFQEELSAIIKLYGTKCTFNGGLFEGAGSFLLIPFFSEYNSLSSKKSIESVIELLNLFLIDRENHILFPGNFCYRLSDDLFSGSSGIILALQSIIENNPLYWLPIINPNNFYETTKFVKS